MQEPRRQSGPPARRDGARNHFSLRSNLTVRKTAAPLWLMWQGTRGYSSEGANAGVIELPR